MLGKLTISLLGAPHIALDDHSLHFRSIKATALLAYLATSGRLHERAELAALLWPESDNKRSRGALRYTLSLVKKALGDDLLIANRRHIGLNPDADWEADVVTVRQMLEPALNSAESLTPDAWRTIQEGVALYQADFLHGFTLRDSARFNDWSYQQSESLRRDLATALKRLTVHLSEEGQRETAVAYAHRWLDLDSLHEPAHCHLMQLYAELDQWTAVHDQFHALSDLLYSELDVTPQLETVAVYEALCRKRESAERTPTSLADLSPDQRSRHVLIEKVRRFWVDALLQPLHAERAFIDLKLQFVNDRADDLIDHPWADVPGALSNRTADDLRQAFHAADRALLILGAPGAGKTVSLTELAQNLLAAATKDDTQPVPVIFNLSGWAERQTEIGTWAVEELVAKYQIPRRIGRRWLAHDRLMFLLDGLDEMDTDQIPACIEAINAYRQGHGLADVVVCCRQNTYETAVSTHNVRLQLNGAVQIRPLTTAQIQQHAPTLAHTLFQDETLLEMAQSPLNLSMLQTTLHGHDAPPERDLAIPDRRRLIETYVQRMIRRHAQRGRDQPSEPALSAHLTWLARQMRRHNQTLFFLEALQPSWLADDANRRRYLFWTHAVMPAIVGTLIMWSFIQLIGINPPYIKLNFVSAFPALFGISNAPGAPFLSLLCLNAFAALLSTGVTGLFFWWRQRRGDDARIDRSIGRLQLLVTSAVAWLAVALPLALTDNIVTALFLGAMAAFGLALTFGGVEYGQTFRSEIRVKGASKWTWRKAALFGAGGALFALVWSGVIWLRDPSAVSAPLNMLNMGMWFFLLGGLSDQQSEVRNRPNEGMRIAVRNGTAATLVLALPALIVTAATVNPASGVYTGLMVGVFAGMVQGFTDAYKHLIVRVLLWRERHAPLNYVPLLNSAADCALLQKVGGGYTFRHGLLLDHFAAQPASASVQQPNRPK